MLWLLALGPAQASASFTVSDIRVDGLQRLTLGTVLNYLPIRTGETIDGERAADAVRALYRTGFFRDIALWQDVDVLVVQVEERPSIAAIELSGNNDIPSEDLLGALKNVGLADGRIFNQSLLDQVEQELRQQYFSRGKYGVRIRSTVTPQDRNRVKVQIEIAEGAVATIRKINVVGNRAFDDETVLGAFQLAASEDLWWSSRDQYSKQALGADLERLRSFYFDRGHAAFEVRSTQVAISSDKREIYVTINIDEGDRYTIGEVKLAGDLRVPEEDLRRLITVATGAVFSRKALSETVAAITNRLGEDGYAFANVNAVPMLDREKREVGITFFIDPGKRVYVRRINMLGNTKTRDEVLRREMRQFEGAIMTPSLIERSKTRLDRLGFFSSVQVATPAVPESPDQVDVNITVAEQPSGSLMASIGYSEIQGWVISTTVSQNNVFGTGNRLSFTINNSEVNKIYEFSHTDPYYTMDGVSRTISLSSRETDAGQANVTNYVVDSSAASMGFGIPLSEFARLGVNVRYEENRLTVGTDAAQRVTDFIAEHGNDFAGFELGANWSYDTRDRTIFPDRGWLASVSTESTLPDADLEFYKVRLQLQAYHLLNPGWTLGGDIQIGYGSGYGDNRELPFFENFYAGGVRSVRGYDGNSLGPRDPLTGDVLGGNLLTTGSLELILPLMRDTGTTRWMLFVDGGNVFDSELPGGRFARDKLRYGYGVGMTWLSLIGPMSFAFAWPYNDQPGDTTQRFQFALGVAL